MFSAKQQFGFELAFHDVVVNFIGVASETAASLECHLVNCLKRFLPFGELSALWLPFGFGAEVGDWRYPELSAAGARVGWELHASAEDMKKSDIDYLKSRLGRHATRAYSNFSEDQAEVAISEFVDDYSDIVVLSTPGGVQGESSRLVVALSMHDGNASRQMRKEIRQRFGWMSLSYSAQNNIFTTFSCLKCLAEQHRVDVELRRLRTYLGEPSQERLRSARRLALMLSRQSETYRYHGHWERVVQLAETVVQEVLGTGLDVHTVGGREVELEVKFLECELEKLLDLIRSAGMPSANAVLASLEKRLRNLVSIIRCIVSTSSPSKTADEEEAQGRTLPENAEVARLAEVGVAHRQRAAIDALIARWTEIHAEAKACAQKPPTSGESEDPWLTEVGKSMLSELGGLLSGRAEPEIDTLFLPAWLRLWFCQSLLWHSLNNSAFRGRKIAPAQKWRFRRDLSYVLRESLRMLNYGHRPDFIFQPAAYVSALQTLVEHHALWVLGLPRTIDFRGILTEIGRTQDSFSMDFAIGHLQHALEIYVAGNFLCQIEIPGTDANDGNGASRCLASVLASGATGDAGRAREVRFRQSFGLAALLHDVGLLLLRPGSPYPLKALIDVDHHLSDHLDMAGAERRAANSKFLEMCAQELRTATYVDPDIEPELVKSLERAVEAGEPEHCLLGAWHLHHFCRGTPGLASQPDLVRAAVRAVLLHRTVSQTIDIDSDPVAALLIICDELFDWSPTARNRLTPDQVGKAFYSLAADVRPQTSRFRRIHIPRLSIVTEGNRSIARLEADGSRSQLLRFKLTLQENEYLDRPLYHFWLSMSQNLERIKSGSGRWKPQISVDSRPPGQLRDQHFRRFRDLLDLAAEHCDHPLRPALLEWLGDGERFPGTDNSFERLEIRCEGKCWYPAGDIRQVLAEVDDAVEAALQERPIRR